MRKFSKGKPKVLDLGCGTGVISGELTQWAEPISLDMSELALAFSKDRGIPTLVQARGEWLPLRTGSVDAVLALDVFEHVEDDGAALKEAFRVLKPGGVLVLSVPAFKTRGDRMTWPSCTSAATHAAKCGTVCGKPDSKYQGSLIRLFFCSPLWF